MHEEWWKILGGTIETSNGHIKYNSNSLYQDRYASSKVAPYVHRKCSSGDSDGCSYTFTELDPNNEYTKKIICKPHNKLTKVTCSVHGDVYYYCPDCEPELEANKATKGWCEKYVSMEKLKEHESEFAKDSKNEPIYPTTNYYLVSNDESVKFRFSKDENGQSISQNALYGNIYAPYIFYALKGDSYAGFVKLFGSALVATMDIQGIESYFGVRADRLPMEFIESGIGIMQGSGNDGNASWKFNTNGYK